MGLFDYHSIYGIDMDGNGKVDIWDDMLVEESLEENSEDLDEDSVESRLLEAGYDLSDLEDMSPRERREALEESGIEPYELDDDFDGDFDDDDF